MDEKDIDYDPDFYRIYGRLGLPELIEELEKLKVQHEHYLAHLSSVELQINFVERLIENDREEDKDLQ
jgi:hypothetical protein